MSLLTIQTSHLAHVTGKTIPSALDYFEMFLSFWLRRQTRRNHYCLTAPDYFTNARIVTVAVVAAAKVAPVTLTVQAPPTQSVLVAG